MKAILWIPWPVTFGPRYPLRVFGDNGISFDSEGFSCNAATGQQEEVDMSALPEATVIALAVSKIMMCKDRAANGGAGEWVPVEDPRRSVRVVGANLPKLRVALAETATPPPPPAETPPPNVPPGMVRNPNYTGPNGSQPPFIMAAAPQTAVPGDKA